jgi:hypothetical protein
MHRLLQELGQNVRASMGRIRTPCLHRLWRIRQQIFSTADKILYRVGQRSCASSILWALLNQFLLAALEEKFDCIHVIEVYRVTSYSQPGDSFVDGTTCGATNEEVTMDSVDSSETALTPEKEALVANMEDIIQFFLDCLQVTGGDLAPEKCVWYLI